MWCVTAPSGLEDVLRSIERTGFGLTLGIHSRIDDTADAIIARLPTGNIYVNRNMIGAVVGVQPFGGHGLSGTGPKAGGPHYLARFATEQTVDRSTRPRPAAMPRCCRARNRPQRQVSSLRARVATGSSLRELLDLLLRLRLGENIEHVTRCQLGGAPVVVRGLLEIVLRLVDRRARKIPLHRLALHDRLAEIIQRLVVFTRPGVGEAAQAQRIGIVRARAQH